MDLPAPSAAARLFAGVTDPRVERTRRHLLCDILLIALCATVRHLALSLAKRDTQTKGSVRLRLKHAGWDDAYLFRLRNI